MGLYNSFYASLSGLSANANALSVIGNNLSNLNTIGYKGSSASFQDLFSASLGASNTQGNGNPIQIGLGTQLGAINQNFGQGSFQSSSNVTDMALQGPGFFTLKTKDGGAAYSRAGNFTIDKNGFMVDPSGNSVMGWNRGSNGKVSTSGLTTPIKLDMAITSPPSPTVNLTTVTNLDAAAAPTDVYSTPVLVYDSLGQSHSVVFKYTKTVNPGEWTLGVTTDGGSTVSGFPPLIQFDGSGKLTLPASGSTPVLTFSAWNNGATSPATNWNIFHSSTDPNTNITTTVADLSGFSSASSTATSTQDGFGSGTVRSMIVDQSGTIIGTFTNGQTIPMAQVAISTFANTSGLAKQGNNTWGTTLSSGLASVGAANEAGRASVLGGNLELSNVDVAEEFTRLIINQRGYQANSRVVTTADSLLQETLNLIR